MEKTRIIRRRLNGQWTVMDSHFLKSLTGTARTCGTRDKFHDFTVHYCPLSRYKRISMTPVTLDFLKVSHVPRIRLRGTREKFAHYSVTGVTVQNLYGWGWVEDVSKILHAHAHRFLTPVCSSFLSDKRKKSIKNLQISEIVLIFAA